MSNYSTVRYSGMNEAPRQIKTYASANTLPLSNLTAGDMAFIPSTNATYITNGSGWYKLQTNVGLTATGGSTSTYDGYKYHVFTSDGSFEITKAGIGEEDYTHLEYLVVAGGGAGGDPGDSTTGGGGGGAGGVSYHTGKVGSVGTYPVTVGAGGSASSRQNGSPSVFYGTTSIGGGQGGDDFSNGFEGQDGGSGGGGGVHSQGTSRGSSTQTDTGGATGYGNRGGYNKTTGPGYEGGGGGGAGAVGNEVAVDGNGDGGDGRYFEPFKHWGTDSANSTTPSTKGYFGGGGGSGSTKYGGTDYSGGAGGGGNGNSSQGLDGTGGGGGCHKDGGDGIVIIRYKV